ncbi:hypothetical protein SESBI_49271 [Sesbania bispinosa]|nr:hypothetical protein SESBI_49271 [Sesbania bispinosa]
MVESSKVAHDDESGSGGTGCGRWRLSVTQQNRDNSDLGCVWWCPNRGEVIWFNGGNRFDEVIMGNRTTKSVGQRRDFRQGFEHKNKMVETMGAGLNSGFWWYTVASTAPRGGESEDDCF